MAMTHQECSTCTGFTLDGRNVCSDTNLSDQIVEQVNRDRCLTTTESIGNTFSNVSITPFSLEPEKDKGERQPASESAAILALSDLIQNLSISASEFQGPSASGEQVDLARVEPPTTATLLTKRQREASPTLKSASEADSIPSNSDLKVDIVKQEKANDFRPI